MENSVVVSSNWSQIGGCELSHAVQQRAANPDIFVKPHLNVLVNEEKSILLSKEQCSEYCELQVKTFPHYKIQAVSFACNVIKLEIFQGPIKEYLYTIYGVIADESDDQFKSYRYDVEVDKSGITDLTFRFLTDSSDVCIFGIMLHTSPNPNGITTLLPLNDCVNLQNILQNSTRKPDEASNKCEKLLELITKSNQNNSSTLDQHLKQKSSIACDETSVSAGREDEIYASLKFHIDERFREIEMRINTYLEAMEQRQNQKLDKILNILEKK